MFDTRAVNHLVRFKRSKQWIYIFCLTRLRWSSWSAALKRLCSRTSCPYRNNGRQIKQTFYITERKKNPSSAQKATVGIDAPTGGSNSVTLCLFSHKQLRLALEHDTVSVMPDPPLQLHFYHIPSVTYRLYGTILVIQFLSYVLYRNSEWEFLERSWDARLWL